MAELKDIMAYAVANYPRKEDLSNARLTKLIYLSDWRHAIHYGRQISNIRWIFDNYGPFVWDVKNTALHNPDVFVIVSATNALGGSKTIISLKREDKQIQLTGPERQSILQTIRKTVHLSWDQFIRLVYSTHPILTSERYSPLDLVALADQYKRKIFTKDL